MCSRQSSDKQKQNVTRTFRLKLHSLTERKQELLTREHTTFNKQIHTSETLNLHSATRQQANRLDDINEDTEHPLVLRNDVFKLEHANDTRLFDNWIQLPIYNTDTGQGDRIWCPVHIPEYARGPVFESDRRDSQLVKDGDDWFVHYTVQTEHTVKTRYSDVIGVDLGAHHLATTVLLSNRSTKFYGKNIRRIREHYKQLKKSVGKAKITSGKQWVKDNCGQKESKRVKHELHRIANSIIENAVKNNAVIVVGDLAGLRYDNNKGRYVNDKVHQMPYSKFVNILEYKANIAGVSVELVGESYTSQTCNWCGERENTTRVGQGRFECDCCGLEENADKNGALNIAKRGLGKDISVGLRSESDFPLSSSGAGVRQPETQVVLASESDQDEPVNSPLVVESASSRARSPRL